VRARIGEGIFTEWTNGVLVACVILYAALVAPGGIALGPGSVSEQIGQLVAFSLLCGGVSFATLEIFKRLVGIRGLFQRRQTRIWLDERTGGNGQAALDELLTAIGLRGVATTRQALPSGELRVFNLPTEQLAAQVSGAADVALTTPEPSRYQWLISGLTGNPFKPASAEGRGRQSDQSQSSRDSQSLPGENYQLAQRVQAGVDQLQISLGERWRRYIQGAALWISGAYGIGLVQGAVSHPYAAEARYVLAALIIGGPFAWIARDLAAVIERFRR
jgi:hypothetical protein